MVARVPFVRHGSYSKDPVIQKETAMKFHIEVDCTPEEVRRLVGLPDLSDVHDAYMGKMKDAMAKGVTPDMVETMVRNWVPMGDSGMNFVKNIVGGLAAAGKSGGDKGTNKPKD
jgi:hypothetical protein